jgi:hypothetical protein
MTITTGPTQATRATVDAGTRQLLTRAYRSLVKAGNDSVRMAWRFGQTIDSFTDAYTMAQLADAMELSVGTLNRYARLYRAYQRVELALEASAQLETFNIDLIFQLQNQLKPVEHGRPMAGRRYVYTCRSCHSHDVGRQEIDPETGLVLELEDAE